MSDTDGPHVTAAFLCAAEPVRGESGRWDFRQVVLQLRLKPRSTGGIWLWFALVLAGGTAAKSLTVWIDVRVPGLRVGRLIDPRPLVFDGPAFGFLFMPRVLLPIHREGTLWIDVQSTEGILVSTPLLITHIATWGSERLPDEMLDIDDDHDWPLHSIDTTLPR